MVCGFSISFFLGFLFIITQFGIQYSDAVLCPLGPAGTIKKPKLSNHHTNCSSACALYSCGGDDLEADCVEAMYVPCKKYQDDIAFIKGHNRNKMFYGKGEFSDQGKIVKTKMYFVSGCGEAANNEVHECMRNRHNEIKNLKPDVSACKGGEKVIWEVDMVGNACGKDFDLRPKITAAPNGSNGKHENGWKFLGILMIATSLFA